MLFRSIGEWVDRRKNRSSGKGINVKTDIEVEIEEVPAATEMAAEAPLRPVDTEMRDESDDDEAEDEEDADAEGRVLTESVGFALNQRLLRAAALRAQGENAPMDPDWEQYLKDAQESGQLSVDATREVLRTMAGELAQMNGQTSSNSSSTTTTQLYPPAASA